MQSFRWEVDHDAWHARMNVINQATRKAQQNGAPAYVYWFQWQTPVLDGRPRAFRYGASRLGRCRDRLSHET